MAADIGGSNRACIFSGYDSTPKKALIGLGGGAAKFLHLNKSIYTDRYTDGLARNLQCLKKMRMQGSLFKKYGEVSLKILKYDFK